MSRLFEITSTPHICGWNTTSSSKFDFPCPDGFWCDIEAKPSHLDCATGLVGQAERAVIAPRMERADDPRCNCLSTCGSTERTDGKRCYCPIGLCALMRPS